MVTRSTLGLALTILKKMFKSERSESMEVARGMTDKIRRYSGIEGPIHFKPMDEEMVG